MCIIAEISKYLMMVNYMNKCPNIQIVDDGYLYGQMCIIAENVQISKYLMMVFDMDKYVLLQTFIKGKWRGLQ